MRERFRNWMRTPSLRGQLIWLSVSSVLVTLLISLLILVLLISNVMGPFVNREAEFAMQTVSRSLSTKTQLLEDILLRICKSPQMTGEASDAREEQFRSLVDIYSDKILLRRGFRLWRWHISWICTERSTWSATTSSSQASSFG